MPVYISNEEIFDIPQSKAEGFEARFPEAEMLYQVDGKEVGVPLKRRDTFLSQHKEAKPFSYVELDLEDAYKERDRLQQMGLERRKQLQSPMSSFVGGMAPISVGAMAENADEELKKIYAASNANNKRIEQLEAIRDGKENNFFRAFGNTITSPSVMSLGITDLYDASAKLSLANEIEEGNELSETDKTLAQNLKLQGKTQARYEDDMGWMYRAGEITAHSIPFMAQIGATGGFTGLTKLGAEGAKGIIRKATGMLADDLIASATLANTLGAGGTMSNILDRKVGRIDLADDNYSFVGGTDWAEAIYKGEVSSILEYYTEKLGGHLEGAGGKIVKGLDNLGLKKVSKALAAVGDSKIVKGFDKLGESIGYNGYLGEVMEEEANIVLNAALVGDNKFSDLVDGRTQTDIWGGLVFSSGFMELTPRAIAGGLKGVTYLKLNHNVSKSDRKAASMIGEGWGALRGKFEEASNDDIADVFYNEVLLNENLTMEQKDVASQYVSNLLKLRGFNTASLSAEGNEVGDAASESYQEGYNATDGKAVRDRLEAAKAKVRGFYESDEGYNEFVERLREHPAEAVELYMGEGDTERAKDVIELINAQWAYDGMQQRVADDADSEIATSDAYIDKVANKDGSVVRAQVDGRNVFVKGGNSDMAVVIDEETGEMRTVAAEMVTDYQEAVLAADEKAARAAEIKQRYANKADAAMSDYAVNDEVMLDINGQQVPAIITAITDDGLFEVHTDVPVNGINNNRFTAEQLNGLVVKQSADVEQEGAPTTEVGQNGAQPVKDGSETEMKPANVPDYFRLDGVQYNVVARNDDGSVDAMADGKRVKLPAGQDYSMALPTDKKGVVQFTELPVTATVEYFTARVDDAQARAELIENNRKAAEKELAKYDKRPNVGTDPDAYAAVLDEWKAKKAAAQAKVDYWAEVAQVNDEVQRSDTREAINEDIPVEIEQTPDEFVAGVLGGIKITPESFRRETGLGGSEQRSLVGLIANEANGGVSVERAAEIIMENYADELAGLGFNGDVQEVRDMIINILSNGNPRSYAKTGKELRAQELKEQRMSQLESIAAALNFESAEEMALWEETVIPAIIVQHQGFDENEYYTILADEYNNNSNNDYDTTRTGQTVGGSSDILQGEQLIDNGGTESVADGQQGGAIPSDVQGGGQNAATQAVEQVADQSEDNLEMGAQEHPTIAAANEGKDTVGGSPVALAYLLEGGQGSILNAGYFLHGVAAAFPAISNEIEALRAGMSGDVLGMNPTDFANQRAGEVAQIGELIVNAYGEEGAAIYNELLNNASGFVPREGKEIGARIEALQPIENNSGFYKIRPKEKPKTAEEGDVLYRTSEEIEDKKTSFSERSGVIPGNSSSKRLLQAGNGHLSTNSLTSQGDIAKLVKNTQNTISSVNKKINEGGLSNLGTVENAVRKVGEALKLMKAKSTQSFYGDLYEGDFVVGGETLHLRISTHPATGERMGNHTADDKISIVIYKNGGHISREEHNGYTEYTYYPEEISLEDTSNAILKGVLNLVNNGEFVDETGKAHRQDYPFINENGDILFREGREWHESSFGLWEAVPLSEIPQREPDYISKNKFGEVSSKYWYGKDEGGEYVVRASDHWSTELKGERADAEAEKFMNDAGYRNRTTPIRNSRWALDFRKHGDFEYIPRERFMNNRYEMYGKTYIVNLYPNVADRWIDKFKAKAEEVAKELNVEVEILESVDGLTGKDRTAKGWFNPKTGKVTIVLPNHVNIFDVQSTVLHEVVAHYGLRALFGENFDTFLDNVYNNVTEEIRAEIDALAGKMYGNTRAATEEYLASLAEKPRFKLAELTGVWQKIKDFFMDMLAKAGVKFDEPLTDNELRYILWRSYNNLAEGGRNLIEQAKDIAKQYDLGVGNYAPVLANNDDFSKESYDIRFRRSGSATPSAQQVYNEKVNRIVERNKQGAVTAARKAREAYVDSMESLKVMQDAIAQERGRAIQSNEDAYTEENHLSSKNKIEMEAFSRDFSKPLQRAIAQLQSKGADFKDILHYLIAKHGLERNRVFSQRDAEKDGGKWNGKVKDYSGLTELTNSATGFTALAEKMVADFEANYNTAELWKSINAATKWIWNKEYNAGMMTKEQYALDKRFQYYVPLRGWDVKEAADEYEYLTSSANLMPLASKKAQGRKSVADNPIANILYMAQSVVVRGNRNLMKQKVLNLAENSNSPLLTVHRMWYESTSNGWTPVFPQIPQGATADQINDIVEAFEADMKAKQKLGLAKQDKTGLNIGMPITKPNEMEHIVRVMRAGREYVVYVNGNPRAAQAVNGLLNPEGVKNFFTKLMTPVKQFMGQAFTSMNPAFMITNLVRDILWAESSVIVKEGWEYARTYNKVIAELFFDKGSMMPGLMKKWENGTLDRSIPIERDFEDFLRNGGETGFTQLLTVDDYQKEIERFLDEADGNKAAMIKKGARAIGELVEFGNRCVEDTVRFAIFRASRQSGRDIMRSVHDAKEITVNFNKKGSGGMGAAEVNVAYLFSNAVIQSTANLARMAANNPKKTTAMLAVYGAAGMLAPILSAAMGAIFGGDDDDYWDLPEWTRRNNICLRLPGCWLTIPLPHELRPFYGLGEICASVIFGKEDVDEGVKKAGLGFADMLPLDFTGNGGDLLVNLTPTAFQPIVQVFKNVDFFGVPIYKDYTHLEYAPEWKKTYKGTSQWLVDGTKWLSDISGGHLSKGGVIDLNPAIIEHLFEGYLGGMGKTFNRTTKSIEMLWNEDVREMRNVPIVSSFVQQAGEKTKNRQVESLYHKVLDEFKESSYIERDLRKEYKTNPIEAAKLYKEFAESMDYKRWLMIKEYDKAINKIDKVVRDNPNLSLERKTFLENRELELKTELFEKLEELENKYKNK